ncbi:MAG: hypothetical protein ACO1TE_11540 [Prosthecobacter sp.]
MTATLTATAEALLREQVDSGQFTSVDSAVEAAIQTVFGHRASMVLESLLDEALLHPGPRMSEELAPHIAMFHQWVIAAQASRQSHPWAYFPS